MEGSANSPILLKNEDYLDKLYVNFMPFLLFYSKNIFDVAQEHTENYMKVDSLSVKSKWLSAMYYTQSKKKLKRKVIIRPTPGLGKGLFAMEEMAANIFLGTYGGLVKRQLFFSFYDTTYAFMYPPSCRRMSFQYLYIDGKKKL